MSWSRRGGILLVALSLAACDAADPTEVRTPDEATPELNAAVFQAQQVTDGLTLTDVTTTLTDAAGDVVGTFTGDINIDQFSLNDAGQLLVSGTLTGDVTDAAGDLVGTLEDFAFETTATLTGDGAPGSCQILFLDLGPIFLDVLGLQVDLSEIELEVRGQRGPGNLLGNLLCSVAGLLDPNDGVVNLLDRITGILDDVGGLALEDITNELEAGGTFEGDINIMDMGLNASGQLVVSGTLTGTVLDAAGDVVGEVEDFAFETTADLLAQGNGGSCQILFLDLGPIFLDVLGLQVDLSPVELEVRGQRGQGNLLGNLLCAVAGLLDPNGGLANLLDRINNLLG